MLSRAATAGQILLVVGDSLVHVGNCLLFTDNYAIYTRAVPENRGTFCKLEINWPNT